MQRLLCLVAASAALASDVTPVQKVIQMLEDMKAKGTKEMEEEQVQYATFKQFCDSTLSEKEKSITDSSDKIETLGADIEAAKADAERLATEAAAHSADIESATKEKDDASALRSKAREDFLATLKDYTESISAVGRALKVLKTQEKVSLVQLAEVKKMLPDEAVHSIDAFLARDKQSLIMEGAKGEPETYEFQSGGVVGLLEQLKTKFEGERETLETEEQAKKHSFQLLAQGLEAQLAQSKKELESKTQFKAKRLQEKASGEGDLAEARGTKESDVKYSTDLKATCDKKAAAFAERQALRKEELEALSKAKDVMAAPTVAGAAAKHLPSLVQKTALAFLRMHSPVGQEQVARFLQQRASQLNSRVLSAAAARAGADPIAKVKTMIEQLLVKMQEQANEEATKKGWCDAELKTNTATREEKADASEALQSEIDGLTAAITKLGEEGADLQMELTELAAAMAQATDLRTKEKAKNAATVKDAQEAQKAVAEALSVLKEFYAKAGEATSLVQTNAKKPEVFGDEPYQGMSGESGGVLGMLEVIQSDFARLQAETESAEEAGKKEYDEFMEDSKVDKATKTKSAEHKAGKKSSKSQELTMLEGDLQGTQKELEAANTYYEKLKPDCVDTGVSYAERKAQREQELKDLQTALDMLQ
ncbi:unnamed protein product [Effrenium voratum]|uniref:Uncharacterized protein n=1 Tax=Effrenium voratum TaxID=2562239 RepID=A0AA36JIK5_9DINO|nr:unnamed protein product [Effrenium voratum]CAJ1455585.1 unnamed protein product [Effrenium voratum]